MSQPFQRSRRDREWREQQRLAASLEHEKARLSELPPETELHWDPPEGSSARSPRTWFLLTEPRHRYDPRILNPPELPKNRGEAIRQGQPNSPLRFCTSIDARLWDLERARILLRGPSEHWDLAGRLIHHGGMDFEFSIAARSYARAFRVVMISQILSALSRFDPTRLRFVTLVFDGSRYRTNELRELCPQRLKLALKQRLLRSGLGDVGLIGAAEVSYSQQSRCWEPHYHLLIVDPPQGYRDQLKRVFPRSQQVPRPVHVRQVDELYPPVSYALKLYASMRIETNDDERWVAERRLPPAQHRAWLMWASSYPPEAFLFLQRFRRYGNSLRNL